MNEILTGQASPEQIAAWKKQYTQGIYALVVDGHIAYFKNPGRNEMNCAMSRASGTAALDMYDDLARRTLIGGSEAVLDDDQMFFGAVQQVKTKMEGKKAQLVNL